MISIEHRYDVNQSLRLKLTQAFAQLYLNTSIDQLNLNGAAWKAFLNFLFVVLKLFDILKLVLACWCDLISFWLQNTDPYF